MSTGFSVIAAKRRWLNQAHLQPGLSEQIANRVKNGRKWDSMTGHEINQAVEELQFEIAKSEVEAYEN